MKLRSALGVAFTVGDRRSASATACDAISGRISRPPYGTGQSDDVGIQTSSPSLRRS
jgi:hypothetical protein